MWRCHYCRHSLSLDVQLKHRLCPNCGSDLHCCKNCSHFDESLSSKCKEPNSPWVRDRDIQNSCEFFEFILHQASDAQSPTDSEAIHSEAEEAKKAFKALFRNI